MLTLPHLPPISSQTKSSSMESEPFSSFQFPPGFRFHPSDEELIIHYLLNKVNSHPLPAYVIAEIELYNYNPWELPKKALFGEEEWFFFSPRDRKYPNGERPNRAAGSGYWKATGTDKPILSAGSKKIGVKKALVFYAGRPPRGVKTGWIMNEYRLPETSRSSKLQGSMRLDNWVLCRVRQKSNMSKNSGEVPKELIGCFTKIEELPSAHAYPNTNFTSGVLLKDSPDKELMGYFTKIDQELPSTHAYSNTNIITGYGSSGCQALATALTGQTLPHIQSSSGGNNGTSLYEDGSDNGSSILENSFFDNIFNATKGKSNEGTRYENLLPSTRMVTNNKESEDISPGNRMNTNNTNFYAQNHYQRDIFSPSPLNAILSFQGLDEYSFTGRFLMEKVLTKGIEF